MSTLKHKSRTAQRSDKHAVIGRRYTPARVSFTSNKHHVQFPFDPANKQPGPQPTI